MPETRRVFTIDINAPIQTVWNEITRLGSVQQAYFGTVLETQLKPGAPLKYRSLKGTEIHILGEVVEVSPPRRFAHTFKFTDLPDESTLVTWELTPLSGGEGGDGGGKGVRVSITHERFAGETETLKRVSGGWPTILGNLKSLLETGAVPQPAKSH